VPSSQVLALVNLIVNASQKCPSGCTETANQPPSSDRGRPDFLREMIGFAAQRPLRSGLGDAGQRRELASVGWTAPCGN